MQNLRAQTKRIMVFSEVAYRGRVSQPQQLFASNKMAFSVTQITSDTKVKPVN